MTDHFEKELFGCTKDCGLCYYVMCVPCSHCFVQAKAVDMARDKGMLLPYCIIFWLGCIGGAINRTSIREKFDVKGNFFTDCLVWCCFPQCAVCQEYREAKSKRHH